MCRFAEMFAAALLVMPGLTVANAATITHVASAWDQDTATGRSDADNLSVAGSAGDVAPHGGTDWRIWLWDGETTSIHNASPIVLEVKAEKAGATNIGDAVATKAGSNSCVRSDGNQLPVRWNADDEERMLVNWADSRFNTARITDGVLTGRIDDIGAAGDVWLMVEADQGDLALTLTLYDSTDTEIGSVTYTASYGTEPGDVAENNQYVDYQFSYSGNADKGAYITYTIAQGVGNKDFKFGATALNVTAAVPEPSTAGPAGTTETP